MPETSSPKTANFPPPETRWMASEHNEPTRAYMVRTALFRDHSLLVANEAREAHQESQIQHLDSRTSVKARAGVPALLDELAVERGMSWVDIAKVSGVSVSAVRKWRKGGPATPENRLGLARLAAVLDLLEELAVADPASWMDLKMMPLPAGAYVRPIDLYLKGAYAALLDYASQRHTAEFVLDESLPGWRDEISRFEILTTPDGERFMRQNER